MSSYLTIGTALTQNADNDLARLVAHYQAAGHTVKQSGRSATISLKGSIELELTASNVGLHIRISGYKTKALMQAREDLATALAAVDEAAGAAVTWSEVPNPTNLGSIFTLPRH